MSRQNKAQLARILKAEQNVQAAERARRTAASAAEANRAVARAAAIRDRAMDNANDRTLRKAIKISVRGRR